MSLVTKCTGCGTTFRVTEPQLQAHNGKVRCGTCLTVFDGRQALITPSVPAQEPPAEAPAAPAGFEFEPVTPAATPAAESSQATAEPKPAVEAYDFGADAADPYDEMPEDEAPRRAHPAWMAGVALLAVLLAGQAVYFYRGDLAARYPAVKPYLVQLCVPLRCTVAPPQGPKQIAIEASDLQALDPARPGRIQLTATLRNHASHDLGFPALDVVLTNTREHTLARRIFTPQEYLDRGRDVHAGLPANAEITVRLDLDAGDLNPAGFRLDLLPAGRP